MSTLNETAYIALIEGDIEWLDKMQKKHKGEIHVCYLDRDYKYCNFQCEMQGNRRNSSC